MVYEPLLDAVATGASLDEVQPLLDEAPEDERRSGALAEVIREALLEGAASDVLSLLIHQDPACAHVEGLALGCSLLHIACLCRAPYDIVKMLLELNPGAIHIADDDNDGDLPLHLLFRGGDIPLHRMLCTSIDDTLELVPMARLLLSHFPEAIQTRNVKGMLPLHHACNEVFSPMEVIDFLIQEYPEGVEARDQENGCLPLHLSCQRQNWNVARRLITMYPDGARVISTTSARWWFSGMLPIHVACEKGAPLELVQLLIDAYPDSVRVRDSGRGWLALHYACYSLGAQANVLELLITLYPDAIRVTDCNRTLPLHNACSRTNNLDCIRVLVQADPLTLLQKTSLGRTALETAYYNRVTGDVSRTSFLLEKQEEVMQSHYDAIRFVVGTCLGFVDSNNSFPELVLDRIWQLARPDVWYPPANEGQKST